jgi:hypothetical protein
VDPTVTAGPTVYLADTETIDESTRHDAEYYTMKTSASVGPNSFADYRQAVDPQCLPPIHFTDDILKKKGPKTREEIFKGHKVSDSGAMVCVDEEAMDK